MLHDWTPSSSRGEISGGHLNVLICWTFSISLIPDHGKITFSISLIPDHGKISLYPLDEFNFLQWID